MTVKFHRKIYRKKAINSAIKAYQGLADFSLKEKKDYFELELKNIDKEVKEVIKDELGNYILASMKM